MKTRQTLVLGAAIGCQVLGQGPAQAGDLQSLLDQYQLIDQLVLSASVQVNIDRPDVDGFCCPLAAEEGEAVDGWFSYIADGAKWRMDNHLDPTKYPGMDTIILFDGATFVYQALDASVRSVQAGPPPSALGLMLLNPAFEPLQFLFPLDDANEGSQPQLSEIKAVTAATTLGAIQWTPVLVDGKTLDRAEFPGATYRGVAYTHHVYAKPNAHDRPLIIDRVDAAGGVITRTRLAHYETTIASSGSTTAWPRNVKWEVYDPNSGDLAAEISMVIDGISVNDLSQVTEGIFGVESLPPATTQVVNGEIQP